MTLLKRLALLLLGFFLTWRFCDHQTEGFSLLRIQSNLEYHPEWLIAEKIPEGVFDQPYHFLGAGAQTFAFTSADGLTVIKFFRPLRSLPPQNLEKPVLANDPFFKLLPMLTY